MNKKHITHAREPFFQIAKELISTNSLVLDIGAGNAGFAKYCQRTDFFMVDGNPETVHELKDQYKNYYHAVLPNLSFNDHQFNLIHCSHVIEHLDQQCFYDTLKEMDRCLAVNGYLVISAPLLTDFFYDNLSHVKPYNPSIFIRYLTNIPINNNNKSKISENYELLQLEYRYKAVRIMDGTLSILDWVLTGLYKIGLRRHIKTGYTIVLQKKL
jgi:ubiquinone/menaquinone biosynthesis C-methylase UbiE